MHTNATTSQIVTCKKGVDIDALAKDYSLAPTFIYRHALNGLAAPMDTNTIRKLKTDSRIIAVEWDSPVELCDQTNSTGFARLDIAHFPVAHINGTNKPLNVGVAILDTGIDPNQTDLTTYTNWSAYQSDGSDWNSHGTEVAGVLCAQDNDFGVVGVAPGVQLWNVQCIGPAPFNTWSYIFGGVEFCIDNADKISVVNMSFVNAKGSKAPYSSVQGAISVLVQNGIVVIAGAGNDAQDLAGPDGIYGSNDDAVPAAIPEVMAVSGMDTSLNTNGSSLDIFYSNSNFSQLPFTNLSWSIDSSGNGTDSSDTTNAPQVISPGNKIDVAAPAVNILTTGTNNTLVTVNGTSFAAPHVAGLAALYIAANGRATNTAGVYAIRQAIINNSLPQSQWNSASNTLDPDTNHEPLAMPSESWVPQPFITSAAYVSRGFQVGLQTVPGYDYSLQTSIDMVTWTNLWTVSGFGALAPAALTDTNDEPQSFYRLKRQPSR
ncbi:MAG TPA: S8 family serine peptidase [Verrucomicrobiae bacterium]|jgi:subtilisin family serine protease|nr:S8 family serine peptidase [Verrucomicrobiae bacterium]